MGVTVQDIINAPVDPAWIGVAAELVTAFPKDAGPCDRLRMLFDGLHRRLGTTDWAACAAVHGRISALGFMDRAIQLSDIRPAGTNPDARALCQAVATAPLYVHGESLVFDPASFQRCLAQARQEGPTPQGSKLHLASQRRGT